MSSEPNLTDMIEAATNAGASGAFVAVLATDDVGGRHHPRNKVSRAMQRGAPDTGDKDHYLPGPWGGFLTALWGGEVAEAWRRADATNVDLMRRAGLPRRHALTPRRAP